MTTIISGSSPSITFSDSTTQTTAFTSTPSVTSITTSADATINGVTVGRGAGGPTSNTAVGRSALTANSSGNTNSAFGSDSLKITDTGYANSAFGGNTLTSNTSGYFNSAFGTSALNGNVSGANNVAVGYQALFVNTASSNTSIGYKSGVKTTSGANNVFVGIESGSNNITGQGNTFIGRASGLLNTGSYNCFVGPSTSAGESCGYYMTTGTKNTILGGFNGNQNSLDIRTASNYVVLSDGDGNPRGIFDGSGNFLVGGATASLATAQHNIRGGTNTGLGVLTTQNAYDTNYSHNVGTNQSGAFVIYRTTDNAGVYLGWGNSSWTANSDERLKTDLKPIENAVNKVNTLRAVTGRYKTDEEGVSRSFLIAQDVQAVLPEAVDATNPDKLGVQYTEVIPLLVAAIKELNAKFDAYVASHP